MTRTRVGVVLAVLLAVVFPAAGRSARAQNYQEALGSRCYQADFGSNYGWDRYTNLCDENINITLIFPRTGSYLIADLRPGKSDGTGHSRNDYARMGEPRIFVCPSGYSPVDDDNRHVTINTDRYRCRR